MNLNQTIENLCKEFPLETRRLKYLEESIYVATGEEVGNLSLELIVSDKPTNGKDFNYPLFSIDFTSIKGKGVGNIEWFYNKEELFRMFIKLEQKYGTNDFGVESFQFGETNMNIDFRSRVINAMGNTKRLEDCPDGFLTLLLKHREKN